MPTIILKKQKFKSIIVINNNKVAYKINCKEDDERTIGAIIKTKIPLLLNQSTCL